LITFADVPDTGRQWLVSDNVATIWTNILAVFLTFAAARTFPIIKRAVHPLWTQSPSVNHHSTVELPGSRGRAEDGNATLVSSSAEDLVNASTAHAISSSTVQILRESPGREEPRGEELSQGCIDRNVAPESTGEEGTSREHIDGHSVQDSIVEEEFEESGDEQEVQEPVDGEQIQGPVNGQGIQETPDERNNQEFGDGQQNQNSNVGEGSSTPAHAPSVAGGQPQNQSLKHQFESEESTGRAGWHLLKWALKQLKPRAHSLPTNRRSTYLSRHYYEDMRQMLVDNFREINLGLFLGLLLIALHLTFMVVSIVSGLVISDSVALSKSPECKLLAANMTLGTTETYARWYKYLLDLETESAEYAKRCYPATARAEECSYFYNQSIHFSVKHNDSCPFKGNLCLNGPKSAFTVTTGKVWPRTIGINTRLNYSFERTTTCAPLRMDEGHHIQRYWDGTKDRFRYMYGGLECNSRDDPKLRHCTWDLPIEIPARPSYRVL
jgi:hypothetical protein